MTTTTTTTVMMMMMMMLGWNYIAVELVAYAPVNPATPPPTRLVESRPEPDTVRFLNQPEPEGQLQRNSFAA